VDALDLINATQVLKARDIFKKMTTDENTLTAQGKTKLYGKSTTDSLFNYANNVF